MATTPAKVYELSLGDVVATKVADGEVGGYNLSLDYGQIEVVTKDQSGTPTDAIPLRRRHQHDSDLHPSSLTLSPDSSGGPVTPAKYFLALDGVKGDSLDANTRAGSRSADFDIDLDNPFVGVPGGPVGRPRQIRFLAADAHAGQQYRTGAAAGASGDGWAHRWCDACRRERSGPTGLPARPGRCAGHEGGGRCRSRPDTEPRLRQDRASDIHPKRHGRCRAGGAVRLRSAANTDGVTVPSALPSGSVASSPQPATYFMLIDGVNGGSTDAQH